ncbi:MAG: hypothetical protein D6824_06945 [Planctomycetota bacterium]|nr:MAG: hypothetical protein D6824_06945 [Planctomycetota bacterium]
MSKLNGCAYCLQHHSAGLERLLKGQRQELVRQLREGGEDLETLAPLLEPREQAMLAYATKLTRTPSLVAAEDVEQLRSAGLDDRAVLDLAQVVAYFCYANRIVLGLGAELESFPLGQHPEA